MDKRVLVTGGAGYIGSHTVVALVEAGFQVVVLDNLERGYAESIHRVEELTHTQVELCKADLRDKDRLQASLIDLYQRKPFDYVIHFAAYKDVGEADKDPAKYYQNNVIGSYNLLEVLRKLEVDKIVFSSTSALYGDAKQLPITESSQLQPKNAYGRSKAVIEWILEDYAASYTFNSIRLRYFNAAGAHPSGRIGEDPALCGNVLPMIMQTLVGEREEFLLYGDNFETEDGTQERDYIHVMDLASAHVAAVQKLEHETGTYAYNLGTGKPTSVKSLVTLSESVSHKKLCLRVVDPRPGDPLIVYCSPEKAEHELNWKASYSIEDIIRDQWNWVVNNPQGY